jgi:hypothetical protein
MMSKGLRMLFLAHGVVTLAAAVVLVARPGLIPGMAGVRLPAEADLVAYLLGAAEAGIGVLSLGAVRVRDAQALRLVVWAFVVVHALSGLLELVVLARHGNAVLGANVVVRAGVVGLFLGLSRDLRRGSPARKGA